MDSTKLFQNAMESEKYSDINYKYQEDEKNYYYSDEGDNSIHPTITIINIINLCNNNASQNNNNYGYDNDYKDKRISYNNSMRVLKNIVHIQQKIRNMSVKRTI